MSQNDPVSGTRIDLANLPPPLPPVAPSPPPWRESRQRRIGAWSTAAILLLYLGFFRVVFDTRAMAFSGGVVSLSYIWSVPFAFGALSVAIGRWRGSDRWLQHALLGPSAVLLAGLLIAFLTHLEAAICILMAAPILFFASCVGGVLAHWLLPRVRNDARLHLSLAVLLPFAAAALEGAWEWPTELKTIETTVEIAAPAEQIWPEIASVAAIDPRKIPDRWIYRIGFPRPIAATLDRAGVGGVRTATFERGVSFFETVTEWDRLHRLAFTIHADPNFIPHTAFDQHIIVGGRFYDVLDGRYEIERLDDRRCRLHLTSHHRLGTRFNAYAGWWSERIMNQIQGSILEVIRSRAEAAQPGDGLN